MPTAGKRRAPVDGLTIGLRSSVTKSLRPAEPTYDRSSTNPNGSSRWIPSDQRSVYGLRMSGLKTDVWLSAGDGARGVDGIAVGKKIDDPRPAAAPMVVVAVLFGESAAMFDSRLLNQVS